MKNYRITVNGNVYDVVVEEGAQGAAPAYAPKAAPNGGSASPHLWQRLLPHLRQLPQRHLPPLLQQLPQEQQEASAWKPVRPVRYTALMRRLARL